MGTGVYGAFTFAVVVIVSGLGVLHLIFLVNWFFGMEVIDSHALTLGSE